MSESSVQLDVWQAYARDWNDPNLPLDETRLTAEPPVDLLMTPQDDTPSAPIARDIYMELNPDWTSTYPDKPLAARSEREAPQILPLEGTLVATLYFDDFLRTVLPRTGYDLRLRIEEIWDLILIEFARILGEPADPASITVSDVLTFAKNMQGSLAPDQRQALVILLIEAARNREFRAVVPEQRDLPFRVRPAVEALRALAAQSPVSHLIWRVARNRQVEKTMRSYETVKADAAMRGLRDSCTDLAWAVIDSGIDGSHPAFANNRDGGKSIRIVKALNFGLLRDIVSYDALATGQASLLLGDVRHRLQLSDTGAREWLNQLSNDAALGRPFD